MLEKEEYGASKLLKLKLQRTGKKSLIFRLDSSKKGQLKQQLTTSKAVLSSLNILNFGPDYDNLLLVLLKC